MKLFNPTGKKQKIHFIDGSSVSVFSDEIIEVDSSNIYKEELERILFKMVEIKEKPKKKETPPSVIKEEAKPSDKKTEESIFGGNS